MTKIGYLGSVEAGKTYDATELMAQYDGPKVPILIDQVSIHAQRTDFGQINIILQMSLGNLRLILEAATKAREFFICSFQGKLPGKIIYLMATSMCENSSYDVFG